MNKNTTAPLRSPRELTGKKVTVMGLGLHGGGLSTVRFLLRHGARVSVTDLKTETELESTLNKLEGLPLTYTLGRHREKDFTEADLIIQNPAVPAGSPFLRIARTLGKRIENDISLFLSYIPPSQPLLAVTGSKGKSTVVSFLHSVLSLSDPETALGGNIKRSPLDFPDDLKPETPVILELSSWQLALLKNRPPLLRPRIALITNIFHDHQNRYKNFQDYIEDKEQIFLHQPLRSPEGHPCYSLFRADPRGEDFARKAPAPSVLFHPRPFTPVPGQISARPDADGGTFFDGTASHRLFYNRDLRVPGEAFRQDALIAGAVAFLFGSPLPLIRKGIGNFKGLPHRLEYAGTARGVDGYNDTAATIPDAVLSALSAFNKPLHLICGGTDKNLRFEAFDQVFKNQQLRSVTLLAGSATEKLLPRLQKTGLPRFGPFASMRVAVETALQNTRPGEILLLSPGCASFEHFAHEFDRGEQFKTAFQKLSEQK